MRELQSDKRKDLAWNALVQQSKNYRVGRELLSVLGKAGLTGLAGAQLASSIASGNKEKSESKNKSSDVKKMANRSNKYFS
jgi:phosphoribosylformylglycinamidine (FGAM) synthase-like enzyme